MSRLDHIDITRSNTIQATMERILIACLLVAGCAEQRTRHDNAALGVSDFVIQATTSDLDIAGIDLQGKPVTRLHLRTGMVRPDGWDAPTGGRELDIEINGQAYAPLVFAGAAPLSIPLTSDAYLNTLVLDPFVAQALSRWGVAFESHGAAAAEVEYAQCQSNSVSFTTPCMISGVDYGALSTCYDYYGVYDAQHTMWNQKVVCNDPSHSRATRLCVYPAIQHAITPCGETGPLGCAVCDRVGIGGGAACLSDSCSFVQTGPGNCSTQCSAGICYSDDDCCACGGYCGSAGECVY